MTIGKVITAAAGAVAVGALYVKAAVDCVRASAALEQQIANTRDVLIKATTAEAAEAEKLHKVAMAYWKTANERIEYWADYEAED